MLFGSGADRDGPRPGRPRAAGTSGAETDGSRPGDAGGASAARRGRGRVRDVVGRVAAAGPAGGAGVPAARPPAAGHGGRGRRATGGGLGTTAIRKGNGPRTSYADCVPG